MVGHRQRPKFRWRDWEISSIRIKMIRVRTMRKARETWRRFESWFRTMLMINDQWWWWRLLFVQVPTA
jgi:hypothetical protein